MAIGAKCAQIADAVDKGQDISVFQTTGAVTKARRRAGGGMGNTGMSQAQAQPEP